MCVCKIFFRFLFIIDIIIIIFSNINKSVF